MSTNNLYLAALVLPVLLVLGLGGGLAKRTRFALVATTGVTLAACMVAYVVWIRDPSHIASVIMFFLIGLPLVTTPVAAIVATTVISGRRDLIATMIAALVGCIVGQVVVFVVFHVLVSTPVEALLFVASPAIYASCAAVVAAGLRGRRP